MKNENPFQQPEVIWLVAFRLKYKNIPDFEEIFEDRTIAISSHEITSETIEAMNDDIWVLELYFDHEVSKEIIPINLLDLLEIESLKIERIQNKDWVAEFANSLEDIKTAQFHIIREEGDHDPNLIPVIINLTRAFGTGDHATTIGCVESMEQYHNKSVASVLDIGTGTGVLAIAAKKLWPTAYVAGTDIDEIALEVASQHAVMNQVTIEFGLDLPISYKFDMILANILARPLIEMAGSISGLLNKDGVIILSGFLDNQLDDIIVEYKKYLLSPVSIINKGRWVILVLV